jgi:hypothetical protein
VVSFTSRPLYPWEEHRTHWTGGCAGGPRAGLDVLTKKKFLSLSGFRNPARLACILVGISTKLPAGLLLPPPDSKVKVSGAQAAHPNLRWEILRCIRVSPFREIRFIQNIFQICVVLFCINHGSWCQFIADYVTYCCKSWSYCRGVLGAFAKFENRLLASSHLFILSSVRIEQLRSYWTNFHEILYLSFYLKKFRKL